MAKKKKNREKRKLQPRSTVDYNFMTWNMEAIKKGEK